jgi:NADH:ubiquinone oxidoreductase subunit 3 (subunit A)
VDVSAHSFLVPLQFLVHLELIAVVLLSAFIESLPLGNFDNIGIFLGVVAFGYVVNWNDGLYN